MAADTFVSFGAGCDQLALRGCEVGMIHYARVFCLKQRNLRKSLWLANWSLFDCKTPFFLHNLFCSKPHVILFPSPALHPQFVHCHLNPPSSKSAPLFPFDLLLSSSLRFLPSQIPPALSVDGGCFFFLHLLWPPLTQQLCHLFSLSIFRFLRSYPSSGVSSSLSVCPFSCFDTASALTLVLTPFP